MPKRSNTGKRTCAWILQVRGRVMLASAAHLPIPRRRNPLERHRTNSSYNERNKGRVSAVKRKSKRVSQISPRSRACAGTSKHFSTLIRPLRLKRFALRRSSSSEKSADSTSRQKRTKPRSRLQSTKWRPLRAAFFTRSKQMCCREIAKKRPQKRRLVRRPASAIEPAGRSSCYWPCYQRLLLAARNHANQRGKQLCPRNDGGGGGSRNSELH